MAVERIPVKGDLLQLDGFFYEVEKVLFSDNGIPRVLLSQENLDLRKGRIYRALEIVNAMRFIFLS
ncbi:MAG: hypothetical protein SWZ49_07650 [Cyanobacteriota bacterium]|nr:hypothetical protein [Cyanobacteriota bacterium]